MVDRPPPPRDPARSAFPPAPYDEALLADLERRLRWAQARVGRDVSTLVDETLVQDEDRSWHEIGDEAAQEYARSVQVETLRNDADRLWEIEDALDRIAGRDELPFGLCHHCADAPQHLCGTCPWIPPERLRAVPWAAHCAQVQEKVEAHELAEAPVDQEGPPALARPPRRPRRTHVRALDRAMQQTNLWLGKVMDRLHCNNREHAYRAVRGTLHALRDRLPPAEAAHLAAQLPLVLRGIFYEGWRPTAAANHARSRGQFLADVVAGLPVPPHSPEAMAQAVFATLAETVSPGEIAEVRHALPRHVRELWLAPTRT